MKFLKHSFKWDSKYINVLHLINIWRPKYIIFTIFVSICTTEHGACLCLVFLFFPNLPAQADSDPQSKYLKPNNSQHLLELCLQVHILFLRAWLSTGFCRSQYMKSYHKGVKCPDPFPNYTNKLSFDIFVITIHNYVLYSYNKSLMIAINMYHPPGWPQCRSLHRSVCPCVRRPSPAAGPCNPDIHNNHDDNVPLTITSLEEKTNLQINSFERNGSIKINR